MSNHYPSQPPLGAMYSSNGPVTSATAASYPGMQQYHHQPPGFNPYWRNQSLSNSLMLAQSTNGYAHPSNTHGAHAPAFSAGVVQAPYGGYANAAQYKTTPTHLQAVVPNPAYDATPYTPQPLVNSNPSTSHEAGANNLPSPQLPQKASVVDLQAPTAAKKPSLHLEDGELSGGDLSNLVDDLYADTARIHERSPPDFTQPYASEIEKVNRGDSYDSFGSVANPTPKPSETAKIPTAAQAPSKVTPSARDQAQAILRELQSYGIGLQELVEEGFEANLLQGLYAETGASVLSVEGPGQRDDGLLARDSAKSTMSVPNSNRRKSQDLSGNDVSGPDAATAGPRTEDSMENSAKANPTPNVNAGSNTEPVLPKDLRVSSLGKNVAKSTVPKPVDRKDYIARLMAAKSGKPLPVSDAESVQTQVSSDKKVPAPDADYPPQKDAQAAPPCIIKDSTAPPMQPNQIQDEIPDIEAKKKAQTELARQKMEALKSQTRAQIQEATSTNTKAPDVHSGSTVAGTSVSTALPPIGTPQRPQMPTATESRQGSYFSPVSLKPAFSIPGLFTASQDSSSQINMEPPNPAPVEKALEFLPRSDTADVVAGNSEGPRKRHKAADFMDSTSTTPNKSLSHGVDNGVIIDVSDDDLDTDDDFEDPPGHHSFKADPPGPDNAQNSGSRSENEGKTNVDKISSPPSIQGLTRQPTRDSANGISTASTNPGKAQEPQELKTKEIEIDTMHRKILELEQRLKAKQTVSRAQSPKVLAVSATKTVAQPQPPPATPQRKDTATEEQLLEEKERQQDMLATAEAEHVQMAEEERQKAAPEQHTVVKSVGLTEAEGLRQGSTAKESAMQAEQRSELSGEDPRQRVTDLEAELSALDADVTRSQALFQQAKLDLERIEKDIIMKADRKRLLQQELVKFSSLVQVTPEDQQQQQPPQQPPNTSNEAGEAAVIEYTDVNGISGQPGNREPRALPSDTADPSSTDPATFETEVQNAERVNKGDRAIIDATVEPELADAVHAKAAQIDGRSNQFDSLSEGGLEEDNMDISGSDVDEGEVLEAGRELTLRSGGVMEVEDDEDIYEPPSHIGSTLQSGNGVIEEPGQTSERVGQYLPPGVTAAAALDDQVIEVVTGPTGETSCPTTFDAQHTLDDNSTQPVTRDEDEYEPPEPEAPVDDNVPPANNVPPHDSAENEPAEIADDGMQLTSRDGPELGHFLPYESPLKQFASYRFHPQYRKEIKGGYRSLTYSHDIRQEVPICQYELGGGVCNDDSCTNQHFQKMALPDHLILGVMGKGEGSTPEEKEAYINGMRSLIFDLRKRDIRDLDAIAEAISQYRLKFLDDASKVLPL